MAELQCVRAGIGADAVPYETALAEQHRLHAARVADEAPDTCLLLEHPAVYTAGRRTKPEDLPLDGTPVVEVDRGGEVTWHGPGQLIGYPIVRLVEPVDVVAHVRRLEEVLIRTCADFGLDTTRVEGRSGVWILGAPVPEEHRAPALGGLDMQLDPRLAGPQYAPSNAGQRGADRKLAAIGVRVARGVTMHGFALNCDPEMTSFDRIVPCGIRDAGVNSLSAELERHVGVTEVLPVVEGHLREVLGVGAAVPEKGGASAPDVPAGRAV